MADCLIALLLKIPQDKLLHNLVGSVVAILFLPFGWLPSMLAVLLIALWRELAGNMHPWDFASTMIGGVPVWFAYWIGHL